MRLWSFQALKSVEELKKEGKLICKWDRYPHPSNWTNAYRWMAGQMEEKEISCQGHAPIWAWHSCGAFYHPPTLDTARNLLSDMEIEDGIQTIEFECPERSVTFRPQFPQRCLGERRSTRSALPHGRYRWR